MRHLNHSLLAVACIFAVLVGVTVHAQDAGTGDLAQPTAERPKAVSTNGGSHYLNDRERGWHWYEPQPEPPPPPSSDEPAAPSAASPAEPPAFSVAWLQKHLETAKIAAIDHPTRENVELYVYLQKVSMDRAEKFAEMTQQVSTLNPALDETVDNPVSTYARAAKRDVTSADRERVLSNLGSTLGIFYFFKSDCPYCAKQTPLLERLRKTYGFHLLPISLDHRPLLDGSMPEWVPDQGQGTALDISSTPTLYLFRPPHELVLMSVGLQTLPDLENKVLSVAHGHGWLADDDFEKAVRGRTQQYLVDSASALQGVDWNNPAEALKALRSASRTAVESAQASAADSNAVFQGTPWTGPGN